MNRLACSLFVIGLAAWPALAANPQPVVSDQAPDALKPAPDERGEPPVSPSLEPQPRVPVYPHEPRTLPGEEPRPGETNRHFETLPSDAPTPEGTADPADPNRPITLPAPTELTE